MHFVFAAPHLNEPTYETFVSYAQKKMSKLAQFLSEDGSFEHEVKISANKEGDFFQVQAELRVPETLFAKVKDRDLRKAIDKLKDRITSLTKSTLEKKRGR